MPTTNHLSFLQYRTSNPLKFVRLDANGKWNNYGRVDAFIFRRIRNHEMTLADFKYWVNVLQRDMNKLN